MPICPPDHVILLSDVATDVADGLRTALPSMNVQINGPVPDGSYAIIGFRPDDAMANYVSADWIHISGAGADGMLQVLDAVSAKPALITRTVGEMGRQIGEYVLSYVLADHQRHTQRAALQAMRVWDPVTAAPHSVSGLFAMIIGTGGIGSGVAQTLSSVGMKTVGVSRSGQWRDGFAQVWRWDSLPDSLPDVDVVIGALPLTTDTDRLIGSDLFARMSGALFINVGRGQTLDVPALMAALQTQCLRHAVLDVFATEPLPSDHPLWDHPQVSVTPHVSGLTQAQDVIDAFLEAYHALERGARPALIVDPDAGY